MKLFVCIVFMAITMVSTAQIREKEVQQFVDLEFKNYPEASLLDLYKNYFQDAYGPGHLIHDTTHAGEYLNWELSQSDWSDTLLWQPLGMQHDFYRINLLLLKNGTIPRDTLLLGMIKSAQLSRNPDIESWKKEWNEVLQIIKKYKPDLLGMEQDEKMIAETLSKGNVVMHHSKRYEETYHPHYRIIHRSIFEQWRKKYSF
jgi:hypothetical protein